MSVKKILRYYQKEAVDSIIDCWNKKRGSVPYISVMTGLGKSLIAAEITKLALGKNKRVLQLVPRKELVTQNFTECFNHVDNPSDIGICCGQLGKHQTHKKAVIAMASSFLSRRATSGAFDVLIVDECQLVKIDGNNEKISTYNKIISALIRQNPKLLICGMTGTPYRMDQGELHEKSFKGMPIWTHKVYDTSEYPGVASLIEDGFLSPIKTVNTDIKVDLKGVRTSGRDYNKDDLGVKFNEIVTDAVADMRQKFLEHNIKTSLIFASNLTNAKRILEEWNDPTTMRIVSGSISQHDRVAAIQWLINGTGERHIINVDILAVGFDYSALQSVVLMRATKSVGLFVQIAGRIIRPHQDKEHGFLLDYGTNIERLGSLDNINMPKPKKRRGDAPKKICMIEGCFTENILTAKKCKKCGAEFVAVNDEGDYKMISKAEALAIKKAESIIEYEVDIINFDCVRSKKADIPMIKMDFYQPGDYSCSHIHYLCLDHDGFAGQHARRFLKRMFIDEENFYRLKHSGISVDDIFPLLNDPEQYGLFFKKILGIQVIPQKNNPKMYEIKNIAFEENE